MAATNRIVQRKLLSRAVLGVFCCGTLAAQQQTLQLTLAEAQRLEPGNPVIVANIGILQAAKGDLSNAIQSFQSALTTEPDLHQARFDLAVAYAKAGRKADAAAQARTLLSRLPATAPQRAEVERLLRQLQ